MRHCVFPGNTVDVTTVAKVKRDLKGWRLNRCVFVGDAGMVSAHNLRTLARGGGRYIVCLPVPPGGEVDREVSRRGRYRVMAENLQVKEVVVGDGERRRRYAVCFNPRETERQRNHRAAVLTELEAQLASLREGSTGEDSKRVCELRASTRYGRYIRLTCSGRPVIDRAKVKSYFRFSWPKVTGVGEGFDRRALEVEAGDRRLAPVPNEVVLERQPPAPHPYHGAHRCIAGGHHPRPHPEAPRQVLGDMRWRLAGRGRFPTTCPHSALSRPHPHRLCSYDSSTRRRHRLAPHPGWLRHPTQSVYGTERSILVGIPRENSGNNTMATSERVHGSSPVFSAPARACQHRSKTACPPRCPLRTQR